MGQAAPLQQQIVRRLAEAQAASASPLMPYKFQANKAANQSLKTRMRRRTIWYRMGLEEIGTDRLVCLTCRKETHISTSHAFRHEADCPLRERTLRLRLLCKKI